MTTVTTISSGQTSSGLSITSGNSLIVLSGGTAVSTTVSSGGSETLSSGGTTSGTVINLGGVLTAHGLLAGSTTDAGKVSGGSVIAGGVLSVTSGGTSTAVIVVSGGTVDVLGGGTALTTTISSGGDQMVSSGGQSVSAIVSSGGSEIVSSAGTATTAAVGTGAIQTILSGGVSVNATVKTGGTEAVAAGGTALGASVQAGGTLSALGILLGTVTNAGTIIGGTEGSGGTTIDSTGGRISGLTIASGGTLVYAGGIASGLVASAGATEVVASGFAATLLSAGSAVLLVVSGTDTHATVLSGGTEIVAAGGSGVVTTVSSGGTEIVASGGLASGTVVTAGGTEIISSGGVLEYNSGITAFSGTLQGSGTLALSANAFTYAGPAGSSNVGVVQQGGTLTLKASETFGGGYTFSGGGGTAIIATGQTLTIGGSANLSGGQIDGPGKLDTTGATTFNYLYLDGGLTWINGGTVTANGGYVYESYPSGSGSIVISNTASGVFDLVSGSYIYSYNGTADSFVNAGTLAETGSATSYISAIVTNTGTISVASGGSLILADGGSFGGTLGGAGTIVFQGGTATLLSGAMLSGANVDQTGGTLSLSSNTTLANLTAAGTIDLNSKTLTLTGSTNLSNAEIIGPGQLDTTGNTTFSYLYLDGGLTWINGGTVTDNGYVYESYPSGSGSVVISNTASGVFDLVSGSYIYSYNGTADSFVNAGTLAAISGGASYVSAVVSNTGTISVASGGSVIFADGGSFGGTLGGAGTIVFQGGTATLLSGAMLSGANVDQTGGTLSLSSNTTLTNATIGGTVDLNGTTLTLTGSTSLTGGEIVGPGQLDTTGATTFNYLYLDGGLTWINGGTVTDSSYVYESYPSGSGSVVISNTASGVFDLVSGSYIYSYNGTADSFVNAGTLAETGSGTSYISAIVTNTGTISVASGGSLVFADGGTFGGTLGGAGTIVFQGGTAILASGANLSTANVNQTGGTLSLSSNTTLANLTAEGTIDLNSKTLTLAGATNLSNAEIIGPGQLATTGATTFTYLYLDGGLTWVNSGTVTDSDYVYGSYPSGSGSIVISNTASGIFNLTSGADIYPYGGTETFINAGTLNNLGNFTGIVSATINNTGTLTATSGTLELSAGGTLAGTLGATNTKGSVLLASGTFTTAAGTTGTIADDGASTGLTLGSGETWTNSGTILDAGHLHIGSVAGGSLATLANKAGSTLTLTGADSGISALGTATINNAGTIIQNGPTGLDTIAVGITNTGLIDAATGTLALTGAVAGTGAMQIEAGGSLELAAALAATQTVTYNGSGAKLILEKPATIKLLKTFGVGDKIDLAGVTATAAGTSGNVLTVSTSSTSYTFTSNESLASDHAQYASDGTGGTLVTLYAGAQAAAHVPEPVVFGNVHVGDTVTQALTITNTAPAGPYTETLDANFGSATTGFTASGSITGLAGGATNSTALTVAESTANAGTLSGTAVLTLNSDGTGVDNSGITPLPSQTVTINGAVYAYAAPSLSATAVNLGAARVGGVLTTGSLTISNGTTASTYQESLLYGATGPAALTITNASGTVAAGGTSTVDLSIGTSTAGDFTGTPVTVGLTSTGAGTSGLSNTTLTPGSVTVNAQVFAPAVAQLGTTTVNVGIIHVGDTATAVVGVTNAGTGALVDLLTAGTATDTGEVSGVSYAGLGSGVTAGSSGAVSLSLNTATAGSISGTAVIGFDSHDSALADIAIAGGTVAVTGTIDNYAVAALEDTGGAGTFAGSGSAYTLNFGTIAQGATAVTADLGVINAAVGPADVLGGSFAASGSSDFTNSGTAAFSGLAAGQADTSPEVTFNTGTAGVFTETLVVSPTGSNASGYSAALAAETITVTGTIVSNGTTYTLTGAPTTIAGTTGNDTINATSNTLNSHDTISGAGGVNTLNLQGAGYFDLGAPATLTNIQLVTAQESAAGTTVYMRNALTVTLNVTPAGSGSLLIYGGTGSNVYNLGAGSDTVVVGAKTETVNAGGGTGLVQATNTLAGVLVNGGSVGSAGTTTLEITNGGAVTLNGADTNLFVKVDSASVLSIGAGSFITAEGAAAGHDTITAGGVSQTLESLGGTDSLIGAASYGDTFLGTSTGFAGDAIRAFGGSDTIDITNILYSTLKPLTYTGTGTSGKLGVSDGTHSVALTMVGSYTVSSFVASTDAHNGTLISFT